MNPELPTHGRHQQRTQQTWLASFQHIDRTLSKSLSLSACVPCPKTRPFGSCKTMWSCFGMNDLLAHSHSIMQCKAGMQRIESSMLLGGTAVV